MNFYSFFFSAFLTIHFTFQTSSSAFVSQILDNKVIFLLFLKVEFLTNVHILSLCITRDHCYCLCILFVVQFVVVINTKNPHEISLKQFSKKPYVCCSNCVITSLSLLTIYLSDKIGNIFHFSGEYHTDKKYTTSHSKSYLNASFSDNAFYDALNYHRITLHYIFHWDGKRERERKTNLLNHGRQTRYACQQPREKGRETQNLRFFLLSRFDSDPKAF